MLTVIIRWEGWMIRWAIEVWTDNLATIQDNWVIRVRIEGIIW